MGYIDLDKQGDPEAIANPSASDEGETDEQSGSTLGEQVDQEAAKTKGA